MPTKQSLTYLFLLLTSLLLSSCRDYAVTVNERRIYTPPPLFTAYRITDRGLQECIEQTIIDQNITRASELRGLNCSSAGIHSLDGLQSFSSIAELNLADNHIKQLGPLSQLPKLVRLHLDNNRLDDLTPLLRLLHLQNFSIDGNPEADCRILEQVLTNNRLEIARPEHCASGQE